MLKKFSVELFFQSSAFDHIYVVFSLNEALYCHITTKVDLIAINNLRSPDRYIIYLNIKVENSSTLVNSSLNI